MDTTSNIYPTSIVSLSKIYGDPREFMEFLWKLESVGNLLKFYRTFNEHLSNILCRGIALTVYLFVVCMCASFIFLSVRVMAGSTQNSEFAQAVIWGTTVNVQRSMRNFQRFIEEFSLRHRRAFELQRKQLSTKGEGNTGRSGESDPGRAGIDDGAHYLRLLHEIEESQVLNLNIDCQDLYCFEPTRKLYLQLIRYPQEMIHNS